MDVPLQQPINDFGHIFPTGLYGDIIGQFEVPLEYFEDHTESFGDPTEPFQALSCKFLNWPVGLDEIVTRPLLGMA